MICLTSVSGESIDKIAEWQQPTYWEALEASTRRARWGHPINVRAAAEWSQCPELGQFKPELILKSLYFKEVIV